MLLLLLFLLLSLPFVQTKLGRYATDQLNKEYETNITIGRVGITWTGDISLKDIFIEDHHLDTLAFIGALKTSVLDAQKLYEGDLLFGDVTVEALNFKLKNYKDEAYTNLDVFIEKLEKNDTLPRTKPSSFLLTAKTLDVRSSRFRYIDENLNTPKILDFTHLNLDSNAFEIKGSNVAAKITQGSMFDYRGVQINHLETDFKYTLTSMRFDDLRLNTEKSKLIGNLAFNYKRSDFKDFNNKVKLDAKFTKSVVSYDDINKFYNEFGHDVATLDTRITGTLNDLKFPHLKISTLNNTKIDGDFNFKNLFTSNDDDFKLIATYDNLRSTYTDLKKILPRLLGRNIPSSLRNLGVFTAWGQSVITTNEIDADLHIKTAIGEIVTDIDLYDIKEDIDKAKYTGETTFTNFNLGRFLDDENFGILSTSLAIDGEGFTLDLLNTNINGRIKELGLNGYVYNHVDVYGLIKNKVFKGKLKSYDENLKLDFQGLVDMSAKTDKYDFKANIAYAELNKLNVFKRDSISEFSGQLTMKMNGSSIDDAEGIIHFTNSTYKNQHDTFAINDLKITAAFDQEKQRSISIYEKNLIDAKIDGKFKFYELWDLTQNAMGSVYANYKPIKVTEDQYFNYNIKIKNTLTQIFYPDVLIHENAAIKGRIESNELDFRLNLKSPKISYKSNEFGQVSFQIDNRNPLFNTYINIVDVKTDVYNISDFELVNKTLNDTLFFRTEFKGGKRKRDNYKLNLYHTINSENRSVFGFKKSNVEINEHTWVINQKNDKHHKVEFDKDIKDVAIRPFLLTQDQQLVKVEGEMKGDGEKDIRVAMKDVQLDRIIPKDETTSIHGLMNGSVSIIQKAGKYQPRAAIKVDGITIDEKGLGDLTLDINGDDNLTNYQLNSKLTNENLESLLVNGNLDFGFDTPYLNVNVELNKFDLTLLNVLGDDVLSNIRGTASGSAILEGDYFNPDAYGTIYLDEAGLKIPYLNTDFDFENKARVQLNKRRFICRNIALLDTKHYTSGRLNGYIEHDRFSDWTLGLVISSDRLLVLDKEQEKESLYYGTAFISGTAELVGPTEELEIKVNARTEKGTVFKIPISDAETIGENSFITVMSLADRLKEKEIDANLPDDISGLELKFDLDVTEDAAIEIVTDQETGSVLKGRGAGILYLEINTNDKFNMFGDFEVREGTYNFVYGSNFLQGGFIEKRFKVKPGGTINWEGNPYNARIDIDAVYRTSANPAILLDNPSVNRNIPVDVVINLDGGLLKPDVNFDIQFPNTSSVVKSELLYKLEDNEFRQKQALSLVSSGAFTANFAIGQGAAGNLLVERATSLVNDIFSEEDDKVKVGLNYEQGETNPYLADARTEDRVGFTVSTQISDRVMLNGRVGIPVGGVTKTVVAGDIQIEFLLNKDGSLRAKIFNRENDFQLTGLTNEIGYTQGIGISHQVDFDTFDELIRKIFKRKKKVKKEDKKEEQDGFIQQVPKTDN